MLSELSSFEPSHFFAQFVASVFFYGYCMPEFTLLLLGSIVANFLVGSKIARLVDA
jgi:alginate O-acetyltransferase complex protein AlgI